MEEQQYGRIASITGQNDILDVKEDLTRLEAYYKVLTQADNVNPFSAGEYIQLRYDQLEEDSTITPATLEGGNCILEGDVMINVFCYLQHVLLFNSRVGSCSMLMHMLLLCDPSSEKNEESEALEKKLTFMVILSITTHIVEGSTQTCYAYFFNGTV